MSADRNSKASPPNKESPYLAFKDDRYRLLALVVRNLTTLGVVAMMVFGPMASDIRALVVPRVREPRT